MMARVRHYVSHADAAEACCVCTVLSHIRAFAGKIMVFYLTKAALGTVSAISEALLFRCISPPAFELAISICKACKYLQQPRLGQAVWQSSAQHSEAQT